MERFQDKKANLQVKALEESESWQNSHYNARKMGRKETAGDASNPLDFAYPRSHVELRGARAYATKNIYSMSSPEPESMKSLMEAELLEENEVKLHSRRDAHKGKHSWRDAHKGNFENYDQIGVDQPKVETCAKKKKLLIMHMYHKEVLENQYPRGDPVSTHLESILRTSFLVGLSKVQLDKPVEMDNGVQQGKIDRRTRSKVRVVFNSTPIKIIAGMKFLSESRQISREVTRKFILLSHVYKRAGIHTLVEFHFVSSVWPAREEHSGKLISYKTFTWKKFPKGLSL
ncbi:hypothetical protein HPP92_028513 [Vanilla planifolia]|uniref:Uncharacterized protein n=1 Tax=Vanilla planifolia TaxID=51239 RepID=A0A835U330_VANPL|nr:hypothetical protein HPP92_028513 [Vanilla planifolia]